MTDTTARRAGCLIVLALLAACGRETPVEDETSAAAQAEAPAPGELVVAVDAAACSKGLGR